MRTMLLSVLALLGVGCAPGPCPEGFSRDNAGNCIEMGGGEDPDGEDLDACEEDGCRDGTSGASPSASGSDDCRRHYCEAYCTCEYEEYDDYYECEFC